MNDTPPEVERHYMEMLMSRTPFERLRMASGMYDDAKALVIAGILSEGKTLSEAQLRGRVFMRLYGGDFTPEDLRKIAAHLHNVELDLDSLPKDSPSNAATG